MRLFREPLIQFLILGGGLFAAWTLLAPAPEAQRERIEVDPARIASLEQGFSAVWKRPPTGAERQGLIEDYLAEEVMYREAQKLGLDQDDVVIRRRMRQKMEFLLQESLATAPPDEDALRAFFDAGRERYRAPDRIGFRQVYLGDRQGEAAQAEWAALLDRLNSESPPDPASLGGGILLPSQMGPAAMQEIDRAFGEGFADRLKGQPAGRWSGPVRSGYGWHLVLIEAVEAGAEPDFDAVRAAVERDHAYETERKARSALIERLRQGYDIVVGEPAK